MQLTGRKRVKQAPNTKEEQQMAAITETLQSRYRVQETIPSDMLDLLAQLK